nr:conserved phage associated protein [uncultured Mediterranean phage uvMED]
MADALRDVTVLSRGGLYTNEDALSLAGSNPGAAIRMLNMEISQFGGYRRISGYVPFDSNHPSVAGKGPVLGVFILKDILYAARRNSADSTPTLGTNPLTVTAGSATITVAHSNHGLVVGNFVTFTGASAVGGITPNNVEMEVSGVLNANSYQVGFPSTASSNATGGGGSVVGAYSINYTIYKYQTSGWAALSAVNSSGSSVTLNNSGVKKLRTSTHTFGGVHEVVIVDGKNLPAIYTGTGNITQVASTPANTTGATITTDFKNHQFYTGFATKPDTIIYSIPSNAKAFTALSADEFSVGFDITGLAKFRDGLFIFGKDRIKKLVGNNISDFTQQEVTSNIGCIATDSVIEIGGDVLFLASDGIRPIQGTARIGDIELETVSKPVQQLLQSLPDTHDLTNMSSVVIRNKSQFRYFFPKNTTAASDTPGIIGGLRFADRRVGWEFGELLGIRSFVATSGLINNIETIVHGDLNGEIFKQEVGNTFNSGMVTAVYATPFLYFDSTEKRKVYQHISLFTRPEGSSSINLGIAYNWDDPNTPDPSTYSLTTAGALSRYTTTNSTYNSTFTFDGSSSPVLETNVQGSGRAISLIITSTGTQAPYSISGFSITYQDAGYR